MSTALIDPHGRCVGRSVGRQTASRSRPGLRLTRRGRLVVLFVAVVAAFVAFTLLGGPAASTDASHHSQAKTVVVRPRQTLWDIATRAAPGQDPRTMIAEIMDLNSLTDPGSIRVGQPLYVPTS
jgi:LysM domain